MLKHDAILWENSHNNTVICSLCGHRCSLQPGQISPCTGRRNDNGKMVTTCYYDICSAAVDPVEKKPLFHFLPGSKVMSIATPGCNLKCDFCQNAQISMPSADRLPFTDPNNTPKIDQVVQTALQHKCSAIAYTYTEPTIYMELAADCGQLAHKSNLKNIFVSNGFMTPESAELAAGFLDAANIDLKSFSDDFYRKYCKASLQPVLDTLKYFARNTDVWLEVTTLLIPGLNDSEQELKQIAEFIVSELGDTVPWHISRFHPTYKCLEKPVTPLDTLEKAWNIGNNAGLKYVFLGNVPNSGMENTICPECSATVIERSGYTLRSYNILNGNCMSCGHKIDGIFSNTI